MPSSLQLANSHGALALWFASQRSLHLNLYHDGTDSFKIKIRTDTAKFTHMTRNSSGDEIANMNFLYDDIVHT